MTKIPSVEEVICEWDKKHSIGINVEQWHDLRDMLQDLTADRLALLTELRDSGLLEDKLYEQGGGYRLGDPTHTVYEKGNNHGHNTLARNIKAHLDELMKSIK